MKTLLHSTPLYSTPLYSTPLYSTPLYSTPLYSTPLYSKGRTSRQARLCRVALLLLLWLTPLLSQAQPTPALAAVPGTVVGWGNNTTGQLNIPGGLSGVTAISAGGTHSLALKDDGTVVGWGNNDFGQINIPAGLSGVTAIVAGGFHNLAIVSDLTAPVAQPSQSPAANANGWNNTDVTVTWNWSDDGSGIDPDNCPSSSTSSGEGTIALTASCYDLGGNLGSAEYTVQVDKTAPVVNVTGVSDGASYTLGSVPEAGCSTDDALSGVAIQAAISVTGGNPDGTGTFTATCSGATDNAGNSAAPVSISYTVEPAGVLVGICGGYEVRQIDSSYSAAGWAGTIRVGSNGNNTLSGASGPDLMLGLGGNDLLDGKGGDDVLCGGDGVDLLTGGAGNDYLDGGDGHDVLNGGTGDYDVLLAGEGNDVLLDGDGVVSAQGGPGTDVFTLALRNGWRNQQGQASFSGLAAGYGNDVVGLAVLGSTRRLLDISGDEYDEPPSPQEGIADSLVLVGRIDATSRIIKFEQTIGIFASAEESDDALSFDGFLADPTTLTDESGAEFLTELVGGDEPAEGGEGTESQQIFLPAVRQ